MQSLRGLINRLLQRLGHMLNKAAGVRQRRTDHGELPQRGGVKAFDR